MKFKINETIVNIIKGDLTEQETEAIVNAANSTLMGGGGVDGAIHRVGGSEILDECKLIIKEIGSLPTSQAVITGGGMLKAKYVIHTVGPIWQDGNNNEDELLANAYVNCLRLALEKGVKNIAFPSISTGAYGFPTSRASIISAEAISQFLQLTSALQEVRMVLFSEEDFTLYKNAWQRIIC